MKLLLDHSFTEQLQADSSSSPLPRQTPGAHYAFVRPKEATNPECIAVSEEMLEELEIKTPKDECLGKTDFANIFTGTTLIEGSTPYAMCYGGHQFGNWAGQLGDGRAINLSTVVLSNGQKRVLQLKGAGPTAYSRRGDGFAVLRSSIREFLCSEAMFHLGVPTTRALSLSLTGDSVLRDMFYDGHPAQEPGAVVCRVSESFIRFGHFEIFAARGEIENLRALADYTMKESYPHLAAGDYVGFFEEVVNRTLTLIVEWMRVGFVHGVMNTDNLSILGETIDYGPYGWLESYDPNWTPNTTDAEGRRYSFGAQAEIGQWNLTQLGNALYPLIEEVEPLQKLLNYYSKEFNRQWTAMMGRKLGIVKLDPDESMDWIFDLLQLMTKVEVDYILFFRNLSKVPVEELLQMELTSSQESEIIQPMLQFKIPEVLQDAFYHYEELSDELQLEFIKWLKTWAIKVQDQPGYQQLMDQTNPLYVMRNFLAQEAIELAEKGDYSRIEELLKVMKNPYTEASGYEHFAQKRPEWARVKAGCSMLSCSS